MTIILPKERPLSLNKLYSQGFWATRHEEAKRVHELIKYSLNQQRFTPIEEKVDITVIAYFDKRPYDSDNIAAKLYIDGLKGIVIKDDNPACVGMVSMISEVDKLNPRIEILIVKSFDI